MTFNSDKLANGGLVLLIAYAAFSSVIRAAFKAFWCDEVITVGLSRLAALGTIRDARGGFPSPTVLCAGLQLPLDAGDFGLMSRRVGGSDPTNAGASSLSPWYAHLGGLSPDRSADRARRSSCRSHQVQPAQTPQAGLGRYIRIFDCSSAGRVNSRSACDFSVDPVFDGRTGLFSDSRRTALLPVDVSRETRAALCRKHLSLAAQTARRSGTFNQYGAALVVTRRARDPHQVTHAFWDFADDRWRWRSPLKSIAAVVLSAGYHPRNR